ERGLEVHVVAPEKRPMERVLGPQIGDFVKALHEANGAIFHLEETVAAIDGPRVRLSGGGLIEADLVVVGIGVRPRTALAESAGGGVARGGVVDGRPRRSLAGVSPAGDAARGAGGRGGERIGVVHGVVAEREGQTAAVIVGGLAVEYPAVAFFWGHE